MDKLTNSMWLLNFRLLVTEATKARLSGNISAAQVLDKAIETYYAVAPDRNIPECDLVCLEGDIRHNTADRQTRF